MENRIDGTARERTRGHLIRAEYERGKTPREIAASVGVDVAIVNGFLGIAEPLSNGKFLLGSQEVTAEELQEKMGRIHADEHADRELDRELGLTEPTRGLDLHRAAMALLASRGNHAPTYDEYANATAEVSS